MVETEIFKWFQIDKNGQNEMIKQLLDFLKKLQVMIF